MFRSNYIYIYIYVIMIIFKYICAYLQSYILVFIAQNLQSRLKMILLRPVWYHNSLKQNQLGEKKNTTQLSQKQRPPIPQNYGYYQYSIKSTRIVHKPKGQGYIREGDAPNLQDQLAYDTHTLGMSYPPPSHVTRGRSLPNQNHQNFMMITCLLSKF